MGTSTAAKKNKTSLSHIVPYPAFSVEWIKHRMVVVTGGGGASKTGIPNGLIVYRVVDGIETLEKHREYDAGDELPYWSKAMPSIGIIAVAIRNRLELIRIDDMKKLATVLEVETPPNKDPTIVAAFSDDGSMLAVGAHDGLVRVYKLKIRNPGSEVEVEVEDRPNQVRITKEAADRPYRNLCFHPNGWHLIGSCEDGTWKIWAITPSWGLELEQTLPATVGPTSTADGVLYTCRCGKFSSDGSRFFTVHYVRRGPKYVDKRPYLTRWAVEEGPDRRLVVEPEQTKAIGNDPIMCLDLSEDGLLGIAGDSEGKTIAFRTEDLSYEIKANMHNFGVTGVSIAPFLDGGNAAATTTTNREGPSSVGRGGGGSYLIASSSGDKTLRLQWRTPPHKPVFSRENGWKLMQVLAILLLVLGLLGFAVMLATNQRAPEDLDKVYMGWFKTWWYGEEGPGAVIEKVKGGRGWGGRWRRQTH